MPPKKNGKKEEKKEEKMTNSSTLSRTTTMDRTIEEGKEFLQNFDEQFQRSKKRKERDEERRRSQSPNKRAKRSSKSPVRSKSPRKKSPKRKASPKKKSPTPKRTTRTTRSTSPKKTRVSSRPTPSSRNAISPPPSSTPSTSSTSSSTYVNPFSLPSTTPVVAPYYTYAPAPVNLQPIPGFRKELNEYVAYRPSTMNYFFKTENPLAPALYPPQHRCKQLRPEWEFQIPSNSSSNSSSSASFALTVNNGKVWVGDDSGDVFGFSIDGEMKRRIKLPSGVKCLVADMGHWLYAGCDDGIVYDLSREEAPRIAYEIDSAVSIENYLEIEDQRTKKRNVIFVLDRSGSMANTRITAATQNLSMVYNNHLKEDDKITLIEFADCVFVRFSGYTKNNSKQRAEMERIHFSPDTSLLCGGSTALWDAFDIAYSHCDLDDDLIENWIILLTDGEDNRSINSNFAQILEKTKTKKENIHLIVIGIGLDDLKNDLKTIGEIHSNDLYIPVSGSQSKEGIAGAFKYVTQKLSSKIIGMEIRDGLIAISDNAGNLSVCDIEGNQNWSRKSKGSCGWMIKADFEGIYHGHSLGVSKYSPMDGELLWETNLDSPVLFGFLDRRNFVLYLSSSSSVYLISAKSGEVIGFYRTHRPVICNAFDYDNHRLFAADTRGNLYCFKATEEDREKGENLIFAAPTHSSILALYYAENKLFASTSDGKLSAYDVSQSGIDLLISVSKSERGKFLPPTRKVSTPLEPMEISQPTSLLPLMPKNRLTDEVIVECYREFDDDQIKSISNSLHDISITSIQIEGVDYPIILNKDGLRYVKLRGLIITQQDPDKQMNFNYKLELNEVDKYAQLAKNGSKVTWIINGEKEWGLVIDDEVKVNGSRLLIRPAANDRGYDVNKIVQFPRSARIINTLYCVQSLTLSENGQYYRSSGEICRIDNEA